MQHVKSAKSETAVGGPQQTAPSDLLSGAQAPSQIADQSMSSPSTHACTNPLEAKEPRGQQRDKTPYLFPMNQKPDKCSSIELSLKPAASTRPPGDADIISKCSVALNQNYKFDRIKKF